MKLTEKCNEDFEFWLFERQEPEEYYNREFISATCLNALIIEWFDSVGIYVTVNYNFIQAKFTNSVKDKDTILYRGGLYSTRQEATEKAIKKANEIYNEHQTI